MSDTFNCRSVSYHIQPRCYETYSSSIERVCHHCGRAMSDKASIYDVFRYRFSWLYDNAEFVGFGLQRIPLRDRLETDENQTAQISVPSQLPQSKIKSRQLPNDIGGHILEKGVHCKYCWHYHIRYRWVGIILFIAIVCVWGLYEVFAPSVGVEIPFLIFIATVFLFIPLWMWGKTYQDFKRYPPFPMIGENPEISIKERIEGNIILDQSGNYQGDVHHRSGILTYKVHLTPDDTVKRHSYVNEKRTTVHAGFILLDSKMDLRFRDFTLKDQPNIIKLESTPNQISQHERTKWSWEKDIQFDPQQIFGGNDVLPIQIVAVVVPQLGEKIEEKEDMNGLELTVQVNPDFINSDLMKGEIRISNFELRADSRLGYIQSVYPPEAQQGNNNTAPYVKWKNILLVNNTPVPYKVFFVRYRRPVEQTMVFKGCIEVEVNQSASGIKQVLLFFPTGHRRKDPHCQFKTTIIADFEIHLQKWFVRRTYTLNFPVLGKNLPPNYSIVNSIVSDLSSNEGYYIQRVIENPPHTNKADAYILNRLWDIGGRWYGGLYPIDFHIVVTGKEFYNEGRDTPIKGELTFDITLQAIIVNKELKDMVDNVRKKIEQTISARFLPNRPISPGQFYTH